MAIWYIRVFGDHRNPDEAIDDGYPRTSPVDAYPAGRSPYGVLDLAGNTLEWCHDWFEDDYYATSPTENPLGPAKGGLSADLDALAAYVSSLVEFPRSPYRNADGTMTNLAGQGQSVFVQRGCDTCHVPPAFTDGLRHDVGTIRARSGLGIGAPLPGVGIETPTLRGLWATAPYLHDGSAASLFDVLSQPGHVGVLTPSERAQLVAYLRELE